jgi:hypothetical protein
VLYALRARNILCWLRNGETNARFVLCATVVAISISLVRVGHSEKVRADHLPHKHLAGVKYENAKSPQKNNQNSSRSLSTPNPKKVAK